MENSVKKQNALYMGVDYGKKVTGLALFHPLEDQEPYTFECIKYESDESLIREILQKGKSQGVECYVIGIPCFEDGSISNMGQRVLEFVDKFKLACSSAIYLQNEYQSSKDARDHMRESPKFNFTVDETKIDAVAAVIILKKFFQS